jgi:hypothetical protein
MKSAVSWARKIIGGGSSEHNGRGAWEMTSDDSWNDILARLQKAVDLGRKKGIVQDYVVREKEHHILVALQSIDEYGPSSYRHICIYEEESYGDRARVWMADEKSTKFGMKKYEHLAKEMFTDIE